MTVEQGNGITFLCYLLTVEECSQIGILTVFVIFTFKITYSFIKYLFKYCLMDITAGLYSSIAS